MKICFISLVFCVAYGALSFTAISAEPSIPAPVMEIEPWGFTTDRKSSGIYWDLQEAIAKRAGFSPKLQIRPYVRVAKEIGDADGGFTLMTENPEIIAVANKVGLLTDLDVIVLSRVDAPIATISELNGKYVAIIHGTDHHHLLDGKAKIKTVAVVKSSDQQLQLLALGRVDAVLGVRQALVYKLNRMSESNRPKVGTPMIVGKIQAFVWLSKNSPEDWRPKLQTAIDSLRKDGTIENIFKKYQ
jgi:polar amino acid transport system substrate-binding protein